MYIFRIYIRKYFNNYIANKTSSNGFISDGPKDATEEAAEIF